MNIEISTINTLLASVVVLQAWMIRELFGLKKQIAIIRANCRWQCRYPGEQECEPAEQDV